MQVWIIICFYSFCTIELGLRKNSFRKDARGTKEVYDRGDTMVFLFMQKHFSFLECFVGFQLRQNRTEVSLFSQNSLRITDLANLISLSQMGLPLLKVLVKSLVQVKLADAHY